MTGSIARLAILVFAVSAVLANAAGNPTSQSGATVAVFNFRTRAESPEWTWMEKGVADRLITSLHQAGMTVLYRDAMQSLADRLHWTPEMMTDPGRLKMITEAVQLDYLVSGDIAVSSTGLCLSAVVVDFATKNPVATLRVSGPTNAPTSVIQSVCAEVVGWFRKKPAGDVREALPAWTDNASAARFLYEGIACYDNGELHEAWIGFAKAVRADPNYIEPEYWLGRTFYALGRFDHAGEAIRRFVHAQPEHPNAGDAVKLHVYAKETSVRDRVALLGVYEELAKIPLLNDCPIPDETLPEMSLPSQTRPCLRSSLTARYGGEMPNKYAFSALSMPAMRDWVQLKRAILLDQMGRYADAATALRGATGITIDDFRSRLSLHSSRHQGLAGWQPISAQPTKLDIRTESDVATGEPRHRLTLERTLQPTGDSTTDGFGLQAPPKYAFRSLHLRPLYQESGSNTGSLWVSFVASPTSVFGGQSVACLGRQFAVSNIIVRGVTVDRLPVGGQLDVRIGSVGKILHLGIVAELDRLDDAGAIEVRCCEGRDFYVEVDGRFGTLGAGPIGPLAPGNHELRFLPLDTNGFDKAWVTNVAVRANEVTYVDGHLPLRENRLWPANAVSAIVVSRDAIPLSGFRDVPWMYSSTTIQADNEAIRVVWSDGGDLWLSTSSNGSTFAETILVPAPVSSSWTEKAPRLWREFSGRFVLTFLSDRGKDGLSRLYWAWSRDLRRWSNPLPVLPGSPPDTVTAYDIVLQSENRMLLAVAFAANTDNKSAGTIAVLEGHDWREWQTIHEFRGRIAGSRAVIRLNDKAEVPLVERRWTEDAYPSRYWGLLKLVANEDGGLELTAGGAYFERFCIIQISPDRKTWSTERATDVWDRRHGDAPSSVSAVVRPEGTMVFTSDDRPPPEFLRLFMVPMKTWDPGIYDKRRLVTVQRHPRWGTMAAWVPSPRSRTTIGRRDGPFFLRIP